ncbi:MAG TPA: molybdopterin-dependent oxidoreductase, partial [Flavobacteriales bacterium]|nr:molybdopterin-dependent oxidoreductase [Flavobacteriales bacterium]
SATVTFKASADAMAKQGAERDAAVAAQADGLRTQVASAISAELDKIWPEEQRTTREGLAIQYRQGSAKQNELQAQADGRYTVVVSAEFTAVKGVEKKLPLKTADGKTFLPVTTDVGEGPVELQVTLTPVERSLNAYPKYMALFEGGLDIAVHVGGDHNDPPQDIAHARSIYDDLTASGFKSPVTKFEDLKIDSGPLTSAIKVQGKDVPVRVRIVHVDMSTPETRQVLVDAYKQSVKSADVVIYDGHAGRQLTYSGVVVAYKPSRVAIPASEFKNIEASDKQQVYVFNGCETYTGYADKLYENPKRNPENTDVITTGNYSAIQSKANQVISFIHSFIDQRTEGWADFRKEVLAVDIAAMERETGVDRNLVREAAIAYASSPAAMSFHGLGVTEHYQGTFTVMQIADLAMMTGNIGRRGVGVNPLRGQNNVQGAADMGAQPHQGAGYLDLASSAVNKQYEAHYGVPMPTRIGWKIPEMFNAAIEGKLKALWLMGEDVVQTDPNTQKVIKAMESLDLLVVQEIFMTETARYADVILPAATFLEKSGTFTNGERRIQRVNEVVPPLEGTKSDGQIVCDVMERFAQRTGTRSGNAKTVYHPDWVLEEISRIVPFFAGVKWEELGENGKQWPVKPDGTDTRILHTDTFKRGLGRFIFKPWVESPEVRANGKDYPYIITTNRDLEHYNSGTMTRRTGNGEIHTEDLLLINPADAQQNGIADGDMVCVESPRGKVDIKARVTDEVKPGILSSTFHFPEVMLNIITSDIHCTEALCPEYKVVTCRIRKARKGQMRKAGEVVVNE